LVDEKIDSKTCILQKVFPVSKITWKLLTKSSRQLHAIAQCISPQTHVYTGVQKEQTGKNPLQDQKVQGCHYDH